MCGRQRCACSPYGARVPVLVSLWSDFHWDDLRFCREHRPADKFVVIDGTVQQVRPPSRGRGSLGRTRSS